MNDVTETELATFVGPNASYYLSAWQPLRSGEAHGIKFNTSAFWLAAGWLLYRRLYRATAIWMAIFLVEKTISHTLFLRAGLPEPRGLSLLIGLLNGTVLALFANRWYYHHSIRQITVLKLAGVASDQALARRGGTSWPSVILGFALASVTLGLLLGLLNPVLAVVFAWAPPDALPNRTGGSLQPRAEAAQTGFNGVVVFRTISNGKQTMGTQTTKGHKARFDGTCQHQNAPCTMIVDADAHVTILFRHDAKVYFTMTEADGKQFAMIPPLKRQLELDFERAGKTEIVAGVPCEVWVGHASAFGNYDKGEACIAAGDVGAALRLLVSSVLGDSAAAEAESPHGRLPEGYETGLLKLTLVEGGSPTSVEAIKIEPKIVDDALFAPPAGYEEVRMADVMIQTQAALKRAIGWAALIGVAAMALGLLLVRRKRIVRAQSEGGR